MVNHWWQVTLYVTPRGLTTSAIPDGERAFDIEFDFCDPRCGSHGRRRRARAVALEPRTVADFYAETMAALRELGVDVAIWPVPVEVEHAIPFAAGHRARLLRPRRRAAVLAPARAGRPRHDARSAARFVGKVSPVHFFWGGLDLAVHALLRPDRAAAPRRRSQLRRLGDGRGLLPRAGQLRVLARRGRGGRVLRLRLPRARRLPRPRRSRPRRRSTTTSCGQFLLPYEAVRTAPDPDATLLAFLQTTYDAAADLGALGPRARSRPRRPAARSRAEPGLSRSRAPSDGASHGPGWGKTDPRWWLSQPWGSCRWPDPGSRVEVRETRPTSASRSSCSEKVC